MRIVVKKIDAVPISNNAVTRLIHDLAADIEEELIFGWIYV
jgi:hypothetical protein